MPPAASVPPAPFVELTVVSFTLTVLLLNAFILLPYDLELFRVIFSIVTTKSAPSVITVQYALEPAVIVPFFNVTSVELSLTMTNALFVVLEVNVKTIVVEIGQ